MHVRLLLAGLMVSGAGAAHAGGKPSGEGARRQAMRTYEEQLAALAAHTTWCEAAKALAEASEVRALPAMVRAYETPIEGAEKACLLHALRTLATPGAIQALLDGKEPEERRVGSRLAELLDDPRWVQPLELRAADPDAHVRRQAVRALAAQRRTPAWEQSMVHLLESADVRVRSEAVDALIRHGTPSARGALEAHLPREQDPSIRARISKPVEAR
jgi:hypothetical protein